MEAYDYIEQRLLVQEKYHSDQAKHNKRCYELTQIALIFLTGAIAILAHFSENPWCPILITIIASTQFILTGIIRLKKYHELWIEYRRISEALRHEYALYLTRTQPYINENPLNLLVERVEAILHESSKSWAAIATRKEEQVQSLQSNS